MVSGFARLPFVAMPERGILANPTTLRHWYLHNYPQWRSDTVSWILNPAGLSCGSFRFFANLNECRPDHLAG